MRVETTLFLLLTACSPATPPSPPAQRSTPPITVTTPPAATSSPTPIPEQPAPVVEDPDAGPSPADAYAARLQAGREAAQRAGDLVVLDGGAWSLQSTIKDGERYQFRIDGTFNEGDNETQVIAFAGGKSMAGPPSISVYKGTRLLQRLARRAPTPDPLDMNTFVGVDPIRLDTVAMRDEAGVHAGDIELGDVNFDGVMDLHVTVGMAHKCPIVQHFLFQPSTGRFVEHPGLGQLNCMSWIADRKLVLSTEWSCCEEWTAVYHWEGSRLVLEKEIWRERGDGGKARITYHEVRNGKPVTRVEETVSEKAEP